MDRTTLFTLGWFRSGTTHLYRILRSALTEWSHFYEPFHPMIGPLTAKYKNLRRREDGEENALLESIHKGELFRKYAEVDDPVEEYAQPVFGQRDFFLTEDSSCPDLVEYLRLIVSSAPRTHLQINRGMGRTRFLREWFPEGIFLCIVRDPRAVWASWQDYPDDPFEGELPPDKFFIHVMLRELEQLLPTSLWRRWGFEWAKHRPPVASFLAVWGFLHQMTHREVRAAPASTWIRYEDLVENTGTMVRKIGDELGLGGLEPEGLPESHTESIHRWRRQSTPAEYRALLDTLPEDNHLTAALRSFGYFKR